VIRATVIRGESVRDDGFEFIGLFRDERDDVQVVLRDLHVTGLYNVVLVHPSKVELWESEK